MTDDLFLNTDGWEIADDLGPGWRRAPNGLAYFSSEWLSTADDHPPGLDAHAFENSLVLPAPAEVVEEADAGIIRSLGRPEGMSLAEARNAMRVQAATRHADGDLSGVTALREARPRDAAGREIDVDALLADRDVSRAELAAADAARTLIRKLEALRAVYRARGRREGGLSAAIISTTGLEDSLRQ